MPQANKTDLLRCPNHVDKWFGSEQFTNSHVWCDFCEKDHSAQECMTPEEVAALYAKPEPRFTRAEIFSMASDISAEWKLDREKFNSATGLFTEVFNRLEHRTLPPLPTHLDDPREGDNRIFTGERG